MVWCVYRWLVLFGRSSLPDPRWPFAPPACFVRNQSPTRSAFQLSQGHGLTLTSACLRNQTSRGCEDRGIRAKHRDLSQTPGAEPKSPPHQRRDPIPPPSGIPSRRRAGSHPTAERDPIPPPSGIPSHRRAGSHPAAERDPIPPPSGIPSHRRAGSDPAAERDPIPPPSSGDRVTTHGLSHAWQGVQLGGGARALARRRRHRRAL